MRRKRWATLIGAIFVGVLLMAAAAASDSGLSTSRMIFLERYDIQVPPNGPIDSSHRLVIADYPGGTNRQVIEAGSNVPEYFGLTLNPSRTELGYGFGGSAWIENLSTLQKTRLVARNENCSEPRWSPDGRWIACGGYEAGYYLKFFDASTLAFDHEIPQSVGFFDWLTNSTIVTAGTPPDTPVCTSDDGSTYQVTSLISIDISSNSSTRLFTPACDRPDQTPLHIAVSPDRTTIAFDTSAGGLYTLRADGSDFHRVPTPYQIPAVPFVHGPEVFFDAVFTLDGRALLVSDVTQVTDSPFGVHSALAEINIATGARTIISDTPNVDTFAGTSAGAADITPPLITCTTPESSSWYSSQVSVSCSASDSGSGLADGADNTFLLSTHVASGDETNTAETDKKSVCDAAGNCTTAGPFGPYEVDLSTPTISLTRSTVDAASPAGAPATAFGPVASDGPFDPNPPVTCSPELVAAGDQVIDCLTTDQAGNTGEVFFNVHVRGALEQLNALLATVSGLPPGKSLAAKVRTAISDFTGSDLTSTCNALNDLLLEVNAQSGKKLTSAQAQQITSETNRVKAVLGC